MGWLQSAAFFCETTGTAKIIMDDLVQQNIPLPPTPLEKFFTPKEEVKLALTAASLQDVYVNDFILAGQPANQEDLKNGQEPLYGSFSASSHPPLARDT
eukprot:15335817-Ditylum_brightwellii.AAC.1